MRIAWTIALLALTALIAASQPQVTWLERQYDFGVFLEQDGKVTCHMRLVNTGNEPLFITKAQAGCGCTGISYTEAPIQPGDTATVGITYNPSGRPGQFTKEAVIFTNTSIRRYVLKITGNVIPTAATLDKQYPLQAGALRISQENIPFGEMVKGQNKTLFLSAYNASTDTVLVHVSGEMPHIHPTLVPDTVPPASVTALTVHYLSGHAPMWGLNVDTLTLSCEPLRPLAPSVPNTASVNVMALVLEDFKDLTDKQRQDAPVVAVECGDRIDFGSLKRGEIATRTFTISNTGKDLLRIRRLWIPEGEGITVKADKTEIKRGKTAKVTITVDTSQLHDDLLNVPLTIMSNDPDSPRLNIRLVGIIDNK